MHAEELKDAIREAIINHIPFELPNGSLYEDVAHAVEDVAEGMEYVKAWPHEFQHQAWAFHLSQEKGMRWGYVRNDEKVGWFEGRETTPLPERDVVMKDSDPVYGHKSDLIQTSA